jgi:hypothetical protein
VCSACGLLAGTPDWADGVAGAGDASSVSSASKMRERQHRIAVVNRMLAPVRVKLRAFGTRLVLQSATGQTRIVTDLAHVWRAADEIGRGIVDPLAEPWAPIGGTADSHG